MKAQTLLLTLAIGLTGSSAQAWGPYPPSSAQCLENARLPHDIELCASLENCEENRCDTGMDCASCKLEAHKVHRHAHNRHLSSVAWKRPITVIQKAPVSQKAATSSVSQKRPIRAVKGAPTQQRIKRQKTKMIRNVPMIMAPGGRIVEYAPAEEVIESVPNENISVNVSNNTAPVEVVVEENTGENETTSLLDPARSNSDFLADKTGYATADHQYGAL